MSDQSADARQASVNLKVEFPIPPSMPPQFTQQWWVQRIPGAYVISAFGIYPPLLTGQTPEENAQQLGQTPSVRAECVARLLIPEGSLPSIIETLQRAKDLPLAIAPGVPPTTSESDTPSK